MKTFFKCMAAVAIGVGASGCKGNADTAKPDPSAGKKVLVCYFSATGTTKDVAEKLATITAADIFEIKPEKPYTAADLDWTDKNSRSTIEMHDLLSRPAIVDVPDSVGSYDIIFLGYPNWWNMAPTIVNTFIEKAGLNGKTVVPFMTSGGSAIENSEQKLKAAYPEVKWVKGRLLNTLSQKELSEWATDIVANN